MNPTATELALRRASRSLRRRPRLESALLTGRIGPYALYRLRFLGWRLLLRAAYHVVEIILLSGAFGLEVLGPVFVAKSAAAVSVSAWWGALEVMRDEVRNRSRRGDWLGARVHIRRWVLGCSAAAALGLAGLVAALYARVDWEAGPHIVHVYGLAIGIRLATDLATRTYHSGIYAIRRVYRSLWSLVAGDGVDLGLVLLTWPWLGLWSLPLALTLGTAVKAPLLIYYVRRAYRTTELRPRATDRWRMRVALSAGALRRALGLALANAATQFDAWLVIALTSLGGVSPEGYFVGVFIYVFRPFIAAGTGWTRLFYFDLQRLSATGSPRMQRRFQRLLRRLSLVLSLTLALTAAVVSWFLWPQVPKDTSLVFIPFFAARTAWAVQHLRAFVHQRVRLILISTAVLASLCLAAMHTFPDGLLTLVIATLVMAGGAGWIGRAVGTAEAQAAGPLLSHARWRHRLAQETAPVCVARARIDRRQANVAAAVRAISNELEVAHLTRRGASEIFCYWRAQSSSPAELMIAAAGCLREVEVLGPFSNGTQALQALLQPRVRIESLGEERARFCAEVTGGVWIDLEEAAPIRAKHSAELLAHMWRAVHRSGNGERIRAHPMDIIVWEDARGPRVIAAMPRALPLELRQRWEQRAASFAWQ